MWEDTNWVTLPKNETEGKELKKNASSFGKSVSYSTIFGQNALQRQDREFAWIELKVDSSASAPPLAVINIYHFSITSKMEGERSKNVESGSSYFIMQDRYSQDVFFVNKA